MTDNNPHDPPCEFQDGDREDIERDALREAAIKRAEVLAWAIERQADARRAAHEATLPRAEPAPAKRIQGAEMTQAWRDYIDKRDRSTMRAMAKAIGETVGKDIVALEKRCAALESEVRELRDRETTRRLRAVPTGGPPALIA